MMISSLQSQPSSLNSWVPTNFPRDQRCPTLLIFIAAYVNYACLIISIHVYGSWGFPWAYHCHPSRQITSSPGGTLNNDHNVFSGHKLRGARLVPRGRPSRIRSRAAAPCIAVFSRGRAIFLLGRHLPPPSCPPWRTWPAIHRASPPDSDAQSSRISASQSEGSRI